MKKLPESYVELLASLHRLGFEIKIDMIPKYKRENQFTKKIDYYDRVVEISLWHPDNFKYGTGPNLFVKESDLESAAESMIDRINDNWPEFELKCKSM